MPVNPAVYTLEDAVRAILALNREGGRGTVLKDITLGQYFPGDSRCPPAGPPHQAASLVVVYIVALFLAKWLCYLRHVMLGAAGAVIAVSQVPV